MLWFCNSLSSETSTGKVKRDLQRESLTLNIKITVWTFNKESGSVFLYFPKIPDQANARKTVYSLICLLLMQLAYTGRPVFTNS